jgi:hypothetical protein
VIYIPLTSGQGGNAWVRTDQIAAIVGIPELERGTGAPRVRDGLIVHTGSVITLVNGGGTVQVAETPADIDQLMRTARIAEGG